MKTYKIEKGTLLHIEGMPIFSGEDCKIEINPNNVHLLSDVTQKLMLEVGSPHPSDAHILCRNIDDDYAKS